MKKGILLLACLALAYLSACANKKLASLSLKTFPNPSPLEVVAKLPFSPGNVSVCPNGRIFVSVHQFRPAPVRVIEVLPPNLYRPFPNAVWNQQGVSSERRFVAPLGVQCDSHNVLWIVDNGNGRAVVPPKLLAFDVSSGKEVYYFQFPEDVAPRGSFVQDLAVDDTNGFVYFADIGGIGRPALIAVNLKQRTAKRFEGHPSLDAENVDLRVEGKLLTDPGSGTNRARVALNPITLSANNEMIFFGAMTGTSWYSVPAKLFREGRSNKMIADNIHFKGRKPVSDGASTDKLGNHFFTAVNDNAIVALAANGDRVTIAQDRKLIWPDALSFGPDGYLYIAVNQLNRAAPFNGGIEGGKPPYLIARVWTGTDGVSGR